MVQAREATKCGYFDLYSPYSGLSGHENAQKGRDPGKGFTGVADEDGELRGAEGSRTLAMDPLWAAAVLCNGGCPSLRRLGPKHQSRAAIVTQGCVGAQGEDSGLKPQIEGERSLQTHQYH